MSIGGVVHSQGGLGRHAVTWLASAASILLAGVTVSGALVAAASTASASPMAAGPEASAGQCRNGGGSPPVPLPCLINTTSGGQYDQWVSGTANRSNSHWSEGDIIPYRVAYTGLGAGTYRLRLYYRTVADGYHAIDYLGSFDATETTSPTPTPVHRNNNNPCYDMLGAAVNSGCTAPGTPPVPVSTIPIPLANLTGQLNACGARSLPTAPTQVPGVFSLFAPPAAGASLTDARYVTQNVQTAGGTCTTTMDVTIHIANAPPGGTQWSAVLAFGGRVASELDWGDGNAASSISGAGATAGLNNLNGNNGAVSGTMGFMANAIAPRPAVATSVSSPTTPAGSTLTDLATVTGVAPYGTPTGHVQFRLCSNATTGCPQGTGVDIGSPVPLSAVSGLSAQARSEPFGADLAPGNYCVGAAFEDDANSFYSGIYFGNSPATECFTVTKASPSISTHLSGTLITVGGSVWDTATLLNALRLPLAAGVTVNYRVYDSIAACQADATPFIDNGTPPTGGTDVATVPVDPATGVVPSATHTFPDIGTFYWAAFFPGDANNHRAVSDCDLEPVRVTLVGEPEISTHLDDTAITVGGSVTDTATLHSPQLPLVTGVTVNYRVYPSVAACQADATAFTSSGTPPAGGTSAATVTVDPATGAVPPASHTFTSAGTFHWAAFFPGDAHNARAVSDCDLEPVLVSPATPEISTHLGDTAITVGGSVTDTATLHGPHLPLAGTATVDYRAYPTVAACQADATAFTSSGTPPAGGTSAATVTVDPATGAVPPASHTFPGTGTFYWAAFFSGDANNQRAVSGCDLEPVQVATVLPAISTHLGDTEVTVGVPVTDTAVLHSPHLPLAGTATVDYRAYASIAACQADATAFTSSGTPPAGGTSAATVAVDPATGAVPPASHTFTPAGTFYWAAFFSGDANNQRAVSGCDLEPVQVARAAPAISTHLGNTVLTVGREVTDIGALHDAHLPLAGTASVNFRIYDSVAACQADATPFTDSGTPPTGGIDVGTIAVNPSIGTSSTSHALSSAGTFYWAAFFSGDANNDRAVSDCDLEPIQVTRLAPAIGTHLGSTALTVGGSVTDTATLLKVHLPLAGAATVDYRVYDSVAACQADATAFTDSGTPPAGGTSVATVTVDPATGTMSPASHALTSAGTFYWAAFFSGDANNFRTASDCDLEPVRVAAATPAISTHLQHPAITVGGSVTDTATLHDAHLPLAGTTTVNYRVYGSLAACQADATPFIDSGTPPAGGTSVATVTVSPATGAVPPAGHALAHAGTVYWAAFFSGDANNDQAVSDCGAEPVLVAAATPAVSTHLNHAAIIAGESVTDTATLHGPRLPLAGTATVNYRAYDSVAACQADATPFLADGTRPAHGTSVATVTVSPATGAVPRASHALTHAGTVYWAAFFSGDANNHRAVSDCAREPVQISAAHPGITVVKTARVTSFTGAGQVITYRYRVTNTGNVPLHDVTVTDDRIREVSCPATTLAAGASMTCTAHYATTRKDADRGHIANAGTVTGTTPGGVRVRARSTLMLPRRKLVPVTG